MNTTKKRPQFFTVSPSWSNPSASHMSFSFISGGSEFICSSVSGVGDSGSGSPGVTTRMADLDFFAIVTTADPRRAGWRGREVPERGPFARSEVARVEARADIARRRSGRSRLARGVTWTRWGAERRTALATKVSATRMTNATDGEISGSRVSRARKLQTGSPVSLKPLVEVRRHASCHPWRSRRLISCPRNARFSSSREATRDGALARARGPAHRNHHVV